MENGCRIIRRSICTFLQYYPYFTTVAAFLVFPFSISMLLSQALAPFSPLLFTIHSRLQALFIAAGFPSSSGFFSTMNLKLAETISTTILTLPLTLSFFLIAKMYIIQSLSQHKPNFPSPLALLTSFYSNPLLSTHILNSFLILAANSTAFSLLFFGYNLLEGLGLSSPKSLLFLSSVGALSYSIILANAFIISNLALVISGMERSSSGFMAILKACILIRGRASTALSLALPSNFAMAAIEALFHFRIVRPYLLAGTLSYSTTFEGIFIAYLYSITIVFDTIVSCMFYRSCIRTGYLISEAGIAYYMIDIEDQGNVCSATLMASEELPWSTPSQNTDQQD